MFYQTEAKPQGWRAVAVFDDRTDRLIYLGRSSTQVRAGYVDAFERYDMPALVRLLHDDAIQSMPPYAMWLQGSDNIAAWMTGVGNGCEGSRLLPTSANGGPAFGQYRIDPAGGHAPWALQVIEVSDGRISAIHSFLDAPALFAAFELPPHLPA